MVLRDSSIHPPSQPSSPVFLHHQLYIDFTLLKHLNLLVQHSICTQPNLTHQLNRLRITLYINLPLPLPINTSISPILIPLLIFLPSNTYIDTTISCMRGEDNGGMYMQIEDA